MFDVHTIPIRVPYYLMKPYATHNDGVLLTLLNMSHIDGRATAIPSVRDAIRFPNEAMAIIKNST